jgi:hypothetical protein
MSEVKEVGEIPESLVPVFIQILKGKLTQVLIIGLKIEDNRMTKKSARRLEEIFEEERLKAGVSVSRTKCVFAYPRHPKQMSNRLSFDSSREVLIPEDIPPEGLRVVAGNQR